MRKQKMDNNFFLLQELVFDTYALNSPVEIEDGVLLLNKTTREVLLKMSLNILEKNNSEISSVTLNIECRDDAGDLISEINPFKYTYRDIFLLKSKSFGDINPIVLDPRVRRVKASIYRVVYMESRVWSPIEEGFKPPEKILINSLSPDLIEQLQRDILSLPQKNKERIVFIPHQSDEYWLCTCGRPNNNDAGECCRCGFSKTFVFTTLKPEIIEQNLENYRENIRLNAERVKFENEQARLREEEDIRQKEEERVRKLEEGHVRSKKRNRLLILIGSIGLLIALFVLVMLPAINYAQASKFLANKEYNNAIFMFHALGDYRNSQEMVKEANYLKALDLLTSKQYDESITIFTSLADYKNSAELTREANYQKANDLLSNKQYDEAITIFTAISDYKNSKELANESNYQKANDLLSNKQYDEAITIFTAISDYKNSKELANESNYQKANNLLSNKQYDVAIAVFSNIQDYKDSRDLLDEARYQAATDLLNNQDYKSAITYLNLIHNKDGYQLLNNSYYLWGKELVVSRQWSDAFIAFGNVDKQIYPDVVTLIADAKYEEAKYAVSSIFDYKSAYYLLVNLNYKDSAKLAEQYAKKAFAWQVEGGMTQTSYRRSDKFTVNWTTTGGRPGDSITILVICTTPDWTSTAINKNVHAGDVNGWEFGNAKPIYSSTGTGTVIIKNYSTGEVLVKYTFTIFY